MASQNGNLQRYIFWALGIILALVGALWAITWQTTDKVACDNRDELVSIKILIAEQQKQYEYLKERIDQIYEEVRDK